jgi:hypothetical protein
MAISLKLPICCSLFQVLQSRGRLGDQSASAALERGEFQLRIQAAKPAHVVLLLAQEEADIISLYFSLRSSLAITPSLM